MSSLNKRQMTLKQPGIISKHNNYSLSNQESPTRSINHVLKRHARAIVRNIMNSNNKSMYSLKNKQREELENDLNKKSVKLFTEACNMSKAEQDLWVTTELTKELMLKLQAL